MHCLIRITPGACALLFMTFGPGGRSGFAQSCAPEWDVTLSVPGMNSPVNAVVVIGQPAAPRVFAAGRFTTAGGLAAAKIAEWNGSAWNSLGAGLGGVGPVVNALAPSHPSLGGVLFAGGQFTSAGGLPANNIARWDGVAWSPLGDGVNGPVFTMMVHDDGGGPVLYVGGAFTQAGGVPAENVARWNGSQWSALSNGANDRVFAMTIYNDGQGAKLYAAGDFTMIGDTSAARIARWNGTGWSAVGGGFNNSVFALTVFEDGLGPGGASLYAGGNFTQNGGAGVSRVARWNGLSWTGLGAGTNAAVRAMTVFDDGGAVGPALYVGGSFSTAGGQTANRIARWNGASWSTLGIGLNDPAFALAGVDRVSNVGPALYVGGSFTLVNNTSANYVARWKGCGILPADMNGDGHLDLADLAPFVECLTGPQGGIAPSCAVADTDFDSDVDMQDLAAFMNGLGT